MGPPLPPAAGPVPWPSPATSCPLRAVLCVQGERRSPEVLDTVLGGRPLLCLGALLCLLCLGGPLARSLAWGRPLAQHGTASWALASTAADRCLNQATVNGLPLLLPFACQFAAFDNMHMEVQPPEPWVPRASAGAGAGASQRQPAATARGGGGLRPAAA